MKKKMRFAPIIRVSTEKQAERGESLETQKKEIIRSVEQLGGIIPKACWQYAGQEHATPHHERKLFDKLLKDAGKDIFDAVMVTDASRWSRDNKKSEEGIEILKFHRIEFYILTVPYDLFAPNSKFFLTLTTAFNEFQALLQAQKSLTNRIERAKRGFAVSGKLPYGRTFDKKSGKWDIDPVMKRNIEYAAKAYLSGEKMPDIAKKLGMNHSNLHKILTKRSGGSWEQRFRSKKLDIDITVSTEIPRLLTKDIIKKILERTQANKTYLHGQTKHHYLLGRMIRCGHCNYAMAGQTNSKGKSYYRHPRHRKHDCPASGYLPAEQIDSAVLVYLFSVFGDKAGLNKAIKDAIPNKKEIKELKDNKKVLLKQLSDVERKKNKLLDMVEVGGLSADDVYKRSIQYNEREQLLMNDIKYIDSKLVNIPSNKKIREISSRFRKLFAYDPESLKKRTIESYHSSCNRLFEMKYEEKRELLQYLLGGKDINGNPCGVYVKKDSEGKWFFEIRAKIGKNINEMLPLNTAHALDLLGIEDNNRDLLNYKVSDLLSKCHAYYSFGFYK